MNDSITVREGAQMTGYSTEYIRALCRTGKIKSGKFGTILMIDKTSLLEYKQRQDSKRTRGVVGT
jgi:excisionase family DNA binding protein